MGEMVKVSEKVLALASMGTSDLSSRESVSALVRAAKEANDAKKAAEAEDSRVKDEFKRMARPYIDEGHGITCYAFDDGLKMTITLSGGGINVDENELLKKLYEMYGEQVGDRGGKAWRAYCAVSDPLEAPRKLNPDKLAYEIAKAARVRAGLESGEVMVTEELVKSVTVEKAPVVKAMCGSMTKAEKKAYEMGELVDVLKVG